MIIDLDSGKIKSITIGNVIPKKGEVCLPDNIGSKEIAYFIETGGFSNLEKKYCINERNPDFEFELMKL